MEGLQLLLSTVASGESLGIWGSIKYAFTWFLEKLFELTLTAGIPSYILAIFVFTLIVKLVMQPLMNKQMRSTRKMSQLQPKLQELQKRYANNPQRQQEETMRLYKEMGVNPLAGCLPLLVQMPILIALFQSLREFTPIYSEYYHFLWIDNLSMLNNELAFPMSLLLPVLAGGATFLQQYLTVVNKQDRTQRMMLYMMPIMFAFFVYQFPTGLAFYWIFYSIIGGLIQFVMNKKWAKEDAIEEEARAAAEEEERLARLAKKAQKKGLEVDEYLEELEEEDSKNVVEVNGIEYYLPDGYSLREKKVKAHPYSDEMETLTVVVLPDGRERDITTLKRKEMAMPQIEMPSLFGRKKKKAEQEDEAED